MTTVVRSPVSKTKAAARELGHQLTALRPQDADRGRALVMSQSPQRPPSGPTETKRTHSQVQVIRPNTVNVGVSLGVLRGRPSAPKSNPFPRPTGSLEIQRWKKLNKIQSSGRVFIIEGEYPDVRKALLERGWVENTDVKSHAFDLKWTRVSKIPNTLEEGQMINHFKNIFHISAKSNLTFNLKRVRSADIDRFYPRTYNLSAYERSSFMNDFKCSAAEGVLKSFLSGGSNIPLRKVAVSLGICQKMAHSGKVVQVLDLEWLALSANVFKETEQALALKFPTREEILEKASQTLSRLSEKCPQSSLNRGKNIWISKPGGKSRGRDIALVTSLSQVEPLYISPTLWVVQKYIENPMLYRGRKFDIRQWVLVSSFSPLKVWFYDECYLRFSVEDYSDSDLANKFIHLTNNSISKHSVKFSTNSIDGCMLHVEKLQEYLREATQRDVWRSDIQPKFKEIVIATLQSVQSQVGHRKSSFELLGYDFLIDSSFTPWLLEVNTSPAMDYSTKVTEALVKSVLVDSIKILIDHRQDTGKFSLIYEEAKAVFAPTIAGWKRIAA